ncbi:RNA polymerase sigma-70 factor (ECF subfamily) [Thermosporothrix hazakensis]|jgi:RNA polymerase sigma-70 factor (ECF subfamily)|uniref:RNA polymerase sigma-70 factor (ECF subfamily) n=1 Tax=Thermosporothrix hazakensis TaxID=644383 RepID=A0A326U919_THEHA|nr:RNA polymerase sigma-70 factor [Thermosporothrix hazakensis]PZW32686.1 RNA polymerase sigma-70 factor (ECF subfamily) [Thermosporothrix hazakensis]GCE50040.1 DNA-directed RNA polymerase sigma-70 factor [Thermosporothrix hazakensis]
MKDPEETTRIFNQYRLLLTSIAYRMLGSYTDAEDIVQEAFVRWLQASDTEMQTPKAYLTTVVVRLCIDKQRSASARREVYVGPWLPEPVLTDTLAENVARAESLSFAFLLMLERLNPVERAIFLLHEVFDYSYTEIAEIVGKSVANCRQILHRAQQRLNRPQARFPVPLEEQKSMLDRFTRATRNGDVEELLHLLADDVVFTTDSNGKTRAGLRPVQGAKKVVRGMLGGMRWYPADMQIIQVELNGQIALLGQHNGQILAAMLPEIVNGRVQNIYLITNPDKLTALKAGVIF